VQLNPAISLEDGCDAQWLHGALNRKGLHKLLCRP